MSVRAPAGRRLAAEEAAVRRDGTAGRRAGGSRRDSGGLRNLAVHSAIVGLAGVFVLGALLLAALAGVLTGTAQPAPAPPSSAGPPAGAAYELVASRAGGTGPFRLWRIGLPADPAGAAGPARRGPTVPVAAGFCWLTRPAGDSLVVKGGHRYASRAASISGADRLRVSGYKTNR
jgi:hypothetical protein